MPIDDNQRYIPSIIVTLRDESVTGHKHEVVSTLKRRIMAYAREDYKVGRIYIGIASGYDYEHALWRRYDYYKQEKRIREMIAIYQSTSQESCRIIEDQLERHIRENHQFRRLNRTGGGGGRNSEQPLHFVYLALQRLVRV